MTFGRSALTLALAFAASAVIAFSGLLRPLDTALMDIRFRLIDRQPTGEVVVVAIDPYSLSQESRWPWSRAAYARALHNLFEAGADLVALDIDFSSVNDPEGDAAFKAAIDAYPGRVILPEFYQSQALRDGAPGLVRTAPNERFLDNAIVAGANLMVEKNGLVRRGWRGSETGGTYRGSIASVLADAAPGRQGAYYLDYSIDPHAIPRLSFADVSRGDFDASAIAGKKAVIGATALELGDEFATPVHGLLSGVVLHALGYESIVQGREIITLNNAVIAGLAAIIFATLFLVAQTWSRRALTLHAVIMTLILIAPVLLQRFTTIGVDPALLLVAQVAAAGALLGQELRRRAAALLAQKRETRRQQALIALVTRDSSDGVIITDASGSIEVCNERGAELLGADAAEIIGARLMDLAPDFPALDARVARAGAPALLADYAILTGDSPRMLEVAASCVAGRTHDHASRSEAATYYSYTLRDVTARKELERAERSARESAVAAASFKSRLISTMSHELRTPLNSIVGFASVMANGDDVDARTHAAFIRDSGGRLLRLVNDILLLSAFDSGDFPFDPDAYSLSEIWEDCIEGVEAIANADGKRLDLIIERDFPTLLVDYKSFCDALSRLVSNAVKFTQPGACIALRASAGETGGLTLTVEDNGPGVAAAHLARLGEAFYQADGALDRTHEGSGLGLHIARRCLELHGAALDFESAPGAGFRAIIRLPAACARSRAVNNPPDDEQAARRVA